MKIPFLRCAFLFFLLLFFCTPQILYASETFSVQVGAFCSKKSAQKLVESLKAIGIECIIHEMRCIHKVSCGRFRQESNAYLLKRNLSSLGHKGVFVIALAAEPLKITKADRAKKQPLLPEAAPPYREAPVEKFREPIREKAPKPTDERDVLIAKETVERPTATKEIMVVKEKETKPTVRVERSLPQEKTRLEEVTQERISGEIFERRGGFLHPFLSITGYYTDNVFNKKDNREHDYVAILSPGIWISLPRIKQQLLEVGTSTISPGGFSIARIRPEFFRRFQTYLLYRADIELFSHHSSENMIDQIAEALFNYNFRGGLSVEFLDQFVRSHDIRGTGISKELDKFRTNLFNMIIAYDISERVKLRADYSNFLVNYEASRNDFRDRLDNSLSGYVFYKFRPKTAAFLQYRFIDVDYDNPVLSNSKEHHVFGGLQWDITPKTWGGFRGGYGIKDTADHEKEKDLILEALINHNFTPKTSINLTASRRTNETNIPTTDFIFSNSIGVEYRQRFTSRFNATMNFSYINDSYRDKLTFGGVTKKREDDYYGAGIALQYALGDLLKLDTGYQYNRRESSFSEFDYINNTVFFRVTGSL